MCEKDSFRERLGASDPHRHAATSALIPGTGGVSSLSCFTVMVPVPRVHRRQNAVRVVVPVRSKVLVLGSGSVDKTYETGHNGGIHKSEMMANQQIKTIYIYNIK